MNYWSIKNRVSPPTPLKCIYRYFIHIVQCIRREVVLAEVEAHHYFETLECVVIEVPNHAVPQTDYLEVEEPQALEDVLVEASDGVSIQNQRLVKTIPHK